MSANAKKNNDHCHQYDFKHEEKCDQEKSVASIPELSELAIEADSRMVTCQMTIDLPEMDTKEMIDGIELGGATTYMGADINLYI